MTEIIYFMDMEGYGKLTEHQKKYIGKSAAFDFRQIQAETMRKEMESFIQHRLGRAAPYL